ncbi:MAG: TlyA family RNA methyltransferase [Chthonomonadales bacterium]|nr:TlyA family RNA methyltransferase [Chthonomonadales bacterium]
MSDPTAERLDRALVARGLAPTRERAQMLIRGEAVTVDGQVVTKPSHPVGCDSELAVIGEVLPYVGRGGVKLEEALRRFRVNVSGARCLDIGASTGGFTDCLLQRGAAHVVALDVGHGQLHDSLRKDPRVTSMERVNARHITADQFDAPFDIVVADVSFISLTLVLPPAVSVLKPGGYLIALIKPEFEAGRDAVGERGVVRDPEAIRQARDRVSRCAVEDLGLTKLGIIPSPIITGGNREYLACFRRPKEAPST